MTRVLSSPGPQCRIFLVALLLFGCAKSASDRPSEPEMATVAQTEEPSQPTLSKEIEVTLYPPKLVMDHQSELGIEEAQRATILEGLRTTQSELVEVDWQLRGEKEKLASVLTSAHVDEKEALSIAERVMRLENQIKAAHLGMLIRIKNTLTEAQQSRLGEIRRRSEQGGPTRATRHPR
jgi:Spy/CpxP family protein refolding chaperone